MRRQYLAASLVVASFAGACGHSKSATEPAGPELSYLSLFPDRRVALVGDAITLAVTARDVDGNDLPDFVPTFTSSDPGVVFIQGDGRIMAQAVGTATVRASGGGKSAETVVYVGSPTYDLASLGPPQVMTANYIDLSKIRRVSRFRSTVGHSYVDGSGETCRSMKHYFQPKDSVDWESVDIYAPASGTIWHIAPDGAWGYRVLLSPRDLPALQIGIFHVQLDSTVVLNKWVEAGEHIGRHASSLTMSDIAVSVGSKEDGTLISYFATMTDEVFAEYHARGVPTRDAAIVTKEERDADPVPCEGEMQFTQQGTLPDWVDLN